MAKRRRTSTAIVRTIPVRAPTPIIRVTAPRTQHKKHHRRRHHAGSGGLNQASIQTHAIGGFVYGLIEKNFGAMLPTLPLVGRAGSIAIGAYMLGGNRGGLIADVGRAAAVIAGYQLGTSGKIQGLAPQIQGIAAQV